MFGDWANKEATEVLSQHLVSIYHTMVVERVEDRALFVSGDRVLRTATIVWAAGIRAPAILAESGLPTDERGCVLVDRYLRVEGYPSIFAAGDCAHIPDRIGGQIPATASYAMRQGEHLARSLMAELEGNPPRAYQPLRLGLVVSLGPEYAVGDPLGMPISGAVASMLKRSIEQWYLTTLR
jgi:NADH dehydrogenase